MWPTSLPALEHSSFSGDFPDVTITSSVSSGPPKVRKRFTAAEEPFSQRLLLSWVQYNTLVAFWRDDLDSGVLPFDYPYMGGVMASVRMTAPPKKGAIEHNRIWIDLAFAVQP